MSDFDIEEKKYLRIHTGVLVTVKNVQTKEWKGTKSIVVTFGDNEDRLLDGKFKLPLNKRDDFLYKMLFEACGVPYDIKKSKDLVGKPLAMQISRGKWQGKTFWNPSGYAPASYLIDSSTEGPNNDQDDINF